MARKKPGIVRKTLGLPFYVMRNPGKTVRTVAKVAIVGTALAAAGLYAYTAFSPNYENGVQQKAGLEKIADDAENIFNDAKSIAGYEGSRAQTQPTKYQE